MDVKKAFDVALRAHQSGCLNEAARRYRQILRDCPHHDQSLHGLGLIQSQLGNHRQSVHFLRESIRINPHIAVVHANLAVVLLRAGLLQEALAAANNALKLRPDRPEHHDVMGVLYERAGRFADAIAAYEQAVAIAPTFATAFDHLGNVFRAIGKVQRSLEAHGRAVLLDPNLASAWSGLSLTYADDGNAPKAIECQRRAVALRPDCPVTHSNLLHLLPFDDRSSRDLIEAEHASWYQRHAAVPSADGIAHWNSPDPDQKLRIGYVSPDFREHPTARLMDQVLSHHDRSGFHVICYADVQHPDNTTERLRALADEWHDITALSTADIAKAVREDGIDILVDLAGHTGSRLPRLFAHKPAPIQVSYYGYLLDTGLPQIDYRLTDAFFDPVELERTNSSVYRLPGCAWCYAPSPAAPPVGGSPFVRNRHITFGCLNRPIKVSSFVADLWERILMAVPESRLKVCGSADGAPPMALRSRHHISHRIDVVGRQPMRQYLESFSSIDIALDPYPHHGGVTTCDALWMGVPVISLSGTLQTSRIGESLLAAVGLSEFVAAGPDRYVALATSLASDPERLQSIRRSLRDQMSRSSLLDGSGFTAKLESAFRSMWSTWCRQGANTVTDNSM